MQDGYVDDQLELAVVGLQHEIERLSDQLTAQGDDIQSLLILGRSMREQDEEYRLEEATRQKVKFEGMERELASVSERLALLEEIQLETNRIEEGRDAMPLLSDGFKTTETLNVYKIPSPTDVLYLNVGGMHMDVMRGTLTAFPDTLLGQQYGGQWDAELAKDAEGRFMVDDDPELFADFVNYLRDQSRRSDGRVIEPPRFEISKQQARFHRMVDSYGLTEHLYRFSLCNVLEDPLPVSYPVASALHTPVANDDTDFKDYVIQRDGRHTRTVDSFEVELGKDTCGAVGWSLYDLDDFDGFCFDPEDRVVLAILYVYRTGLQESITFRLGDVTQSIPTNAVVRDNEPIRIRCANKGAEWYINDVLVATTPSVRKALTNRVDPAPYVSCTKGYICFTDILLDA